MLYRVIGVMSGSSLDGLDLAFVEIEELGGKWQYSLLQADCYAGVWASKHRELIEPGDLEEGMRAASAIGDDTLQRQAGQQVHGVSPKTGPSPRTLSARRQRATIRAARVSASARSVCCSRRSTTCSRTRSTWPPAAPRASRSGAG